MTSASGRGCGVQHRSAPRGSLESVSLCVCDDAAYSLVPIGESERSGVMGDYFTPEYAYMWARDFPRLRAMGVNTIRIYTWNTEVDHTPFLDACHQWGLKVFITHGIG